MSMKSSKNNKKVPYGISYVMVDKIDEIYNTYGINAMDNYLFSNVVLPYNIEQITINHNSRFMNKKLELDILQRHDSGIEVVENYLMDKYKHIICYSIKATNQPKSNCCIQFYCIAK